MKGYCALYEEKHNLLIGDRTAEEIKIKNWYNVSSGRN